MNDTCHQLRAARALRVWVLAILAMVMTATQLRAQGCIAARQPGCPVTQMVCTSNTIENAAHGRWYSASHWSIAGEYRNQYSDRHFVGKQEQYYRMAQHTQVTNNINVLDLDVTYDFNLRTSLTLDAPIEWNRRTIPGTIYQLRGFANAPDEVFHTRGLSDLTLSAQTWLLSPARHMSHNVAIIYGVKFPTGDYSNAQTVNTVKGPQSLTADQSIQLGDGGWGVVLGANAYQQIHQYTWYFTGNYLFNPRETNGVQTGRSLPGEQIMSVSDQYLARSGFVIPVGQQSHWRWFRPYSMTMGVRAEGVPARDIFGGSQGFRRPGYILSVDPGIEYNGEENSWNFNFPVPFQRNRTISVADHLNHTHGDAAFADYLFLIGFSHHF